MVIGAVDRDRGRALRQGHRQPADAGHRLVPGGAVPAAGDRAGQDARAVARRDHLRDRGHLLARHGADHPGPGARRRDPPVPGTLPRAGRRALAPDVQARAAQRDAAAAGQHDPDRRRRHPGRDHAVVPRPRRPAPAVLGGDAQRGVLHRRRQRPATSCGCSRPAWPSSWWCWPSRMVGHALETVLDPKLRER